MAAKIFTISCGNSPQMYTATTMVTQATARKICGMPNPVNNMIDAATARKDDGSGWVYPQVKSVVKVGFGEEYQITFRAGIEQDARSEVEVIFEESPWVARLERDITVDSFLREREDASPDI